ncbi:anti-sigma factor family protein [Nocardioides sp.]|uniref:anti-sigma factor family protein n=1 Tax=Nocardioides sp. TaxID=35761 RepID=UPI003D10A024
MTDHAAQDRELREMLGAYVLGHLSADESARVEAHLAGCAECTADLEELLPAADALSLLRGAPLRVAAEEPPPELGERIVGAVSSAHRVEDRRRWLRSASIAAVGAAAAAVVIVAGVAMTREDSQPAVPLEAVAVQEDVPGLAATADLVAHTWGVEVKLTAVGFDRGSRYRVAVIGLDGRRYSAGGFVGTGEREMLCNLNSSVLRDRARGFEVTDPNGRVVAESTFS